MLKLTLSSSSRLFSLRLVIFLLDLINFLLTVSDSSKSGNSMSLSLLGELKKEFIPCGYDVVPLKTIIAFSSSFSEVHPTLELVVIRILGSPAACFDIRLLLLLKRKGVL